MKMLRALVVALVCLTGMPAKAVEVITQFDSQINLRDNGDLIVTETITVNAEAKEIKRGIFRDLPTTTLDGDGDLQQVSYKVYSVRRDGKSEPYFIRNQADGIRIYIGDKNVFLPPGRHTYTLTYTTARQTRHFADHAEVYWNVTGNEWQFPIAKATATVRLPKDGQVVDTVAFTGRRGSKASNATAVASADGHSARFETTRFLTKREGLTVVVKFEKTLVPKPKKIPYKSVIDTYDAAIKLNADGTVDVTERLKLVVTKADPIYRTPTLDLTHYSDSPLSHETDISDISITLDGAPMPFELKEWSRERRLRLTSGSTEFPPGSYEFVVKYTTDRRVMFGHDDDTFVWQGLPLGLDKRIKAATVTVTIPGASQSLRPSFLLGSTFRKEATGASASVNAAGTEVVFKTTDPLQERDEFLLSLAMPKGIVDAPSFRTRLGWFWADDSPFVIGMIMALLIGLYYMIGWALVGRDPRGGTVVPRWDAPDGASPALVSYIEHKGLVGRGRNAMAAGLLSLAVKGHIKMSRLNADMKLERTSRNAPGNLPAGEKAMMKNIKSSGITFNQKNSTRVAYLTSGFSKAMEREHREKFYKANWGWFWGGLGGSLLALAIYIFHDGGFTNEFFDNFGGLFLAGIVSTLAVIVLLIVLRVLTRTLELSSRLWVISILAIAAFVALAVFGSALRESIIEAMDFDIFLVLPIAGIVGLNILFFFLIGAPTELGRKMMDGIEGLRLYISMAETDRMNMRGAPTMSPRHYETLLPYAVALKLEKPWSAAFGRWLDAAEKATGEAQSYNPQWNATWRHRGFDDRMNFETSIARSFAASIPTPTYSSSSGGSSGFSSGSSSSGFSSSGGFSGGGGGGGGGGGW